MKKVTNTEAPGAITNEEVIRQANTADNMLAEAKNTEKRLKNKLVRVPVLHGFIMTTDPEKWEAHKKAESL